MIIEDDLRHPILDDLGEQWLGISAAEDDPFPGEMVDAIPNLLATVRAAPNGALVARSSGLPQAALSISSRLFGKSAEAAAAGIGSYESGRWLAAVSTIYSANYLLAKSILYLFGILPVGRDIGRTIDIFADDTDRRPQSVQMQVWHTKRWDHAQVWAILQRVLRTLKAEREIRAEFASLRLLDWSHFSRRRNRYHYSDGYLSQSHEAEHLSIPQDRVLDLKRASEFVDVRRENMEAGFYLRVFFELSKLQAVVADAAAVSDFFSAMCVVPRKVLIAA